MALFKRKKKTEDKVEEQKKDEKVEGKKAEKAVKKSAQKKTDKTKKQKNQETKEQKDEKTRKKKEEVEIIGESRLKRFWISEKATDMGQYGKYVFVVDPQTNKSEIKKEVAKRFKVKVTGVNVIRREGKRKRAGQTWGRRPSHKKAIVTLKKGEKIETI